VRSRMTVVAIVAFLAGMATGALTRHFLQPADPPLVQSIRQIELELNSLPRLEWRQ
jgi:hypothetical protein